MTPMPKPAGAGRRLGALRRRWRLVVLVALLALAVAVIWSVSRPPIYEATASVLVSPVATPSDRGTAGQLLNMRDEQQVARSLPVARIVVERFGSSATPEQLLRHVAVEVPGGSRILHITYADRVRSTARTGADAFAAAYLAYRRDAVAAQVQSLVANLTREIADLTARKQDQDAVLAPERQATPSQRDAALTLREAYGRQIADLQQQRRALQGASSVDPGSVIQPARLPGRSLPGPLLNAALGLAVGLLLGVALAFVYDRVDRRLRGRDDLAELLDRPVLTPIPPLNSWRKPFGRRRRTQGLVMLEQPDSPGAEAYRTLRTRVAFLAGRLQVTSIMVTSAGPAEGKSTVAANLALALAETERDVLLVSADLRQPRVHQFFALPNRSGLPDVLTDELLRDGKVPASAMQDRIACEYWSVARYLWVIVSRPAPPKVAAQLGSDAMRRLLEAQRESFDYIILDCPPALAAADALALAPLVDAVLVVADSGSTNRSAVARLREQLDQAGGKVLGAVLNRDRSSPGAYQYEG
jgi:capsular exopolysaccharide synthesis family protein